VNWRVIIFPFFILFINFNLYSQGEIVDERKILFRNESSFGLELTSTGWGLNYVYGKHLDNRNKDLFEIQLVEIKHPKEVKSTNPYYPNQKKFVFGKVNSFYNLRFGYGKQKKLFSKADKGGIEIRMFYTGGLNLGLVKPIYYEVVDSQFVVNDMYYLVTETTTFNPNIHSPYDIIARAGFLKGFNETKIVPGVYGSMGVGFEFSESDKVLNSLEAGVTVDLFPKSVEIMSERGKFYYVSLFVCYRFGKVKNARIKEKKKKDQIETE
jgi:hypothetical protein